MNTLACSILFPAVENALRSMGAVSVVLEGAIHCPFQSFLSRSPIPQLAVSLHAEATPHHFTLTEDAVLEHGTLAKMNPPLRTEADRQKIIEGLIDGTIDLIATDHAPHSTEEKSKPVTEAPSGIIGLETSLALGITSLVKPGHLSMLELLKKMTINPARLYHMPYGTISEGAAADFVIFDPDEKWVPCEYASKSSNTPFTGMELTGKVKYTVCGGNVIYSDK